jgi:hypothetical protein
MPIMYELALGSWASNKLRKGRTKLFKMFIITNFRSRHLPRWLGMTYGIDSSAKERLTTYLRVLTSRRGLNLRNDPVYPVYRGPNPSDNQSPSSRVTACQRQSDEWRAAFLRSISASQDDVTSCMKDVCTWMLQLKFSKTEILLCCSSNG